MLLMRTTYADMNHTNTPPLVAHAACPTPSGFTLAPGMDVVGNDIACNPLGTNTPGDLASRCQATAGCVAFNIHQQPGGVPNYCLKSARSPVSDQSTTWMKGACQGIYTGARRSRGCHLTRCCLCAPWPAPHHVP
jgi:hypothetical protein